MALRKKADPVPHEDVPIEVESDTSGVAEKRASQLENNTARVVLAKSFCLNGVTYGPGPADVPADAWHVWKDLVEKE